MTLRSSVICEMVVQSMIFIVSCPGPFALLDQQLQYFRMKFSRSSSASGYKVQLFHKVARLLTKKPIRSCGGSLKVLLCASPHCHASLHESI